MLEQKICPCCLVRPVAINYYKYGKTYYRNKCYICYRLKRKPSPPGWIKSGYHKTEKCEKCGFRFKFDEQAIVVHIDGITTNNNWVNLKTICLNCQVAVEHSVLPWKKDKLKPD